MYYMKPVANHLNSPPYVIYVLRELVDLFQRMMDFHARAGQNMIAEFDQVDSKR